MTMMPIPAGTDTASDGDVLGQLGGPRHATDPRLLIEPADPVGLAAYRELRRSHFVDRRGLFDVTDLDDVDDHDDTIVLVAREVSTPVGSTRGDRGDRGDGAGAVVGGVRLHPVGDRDDGWWIGGRLVVDTDVRHGGTSGVGASLVRAACSLAETEGAIRFDAFVQPDREGFFADLGWSRRGDVVLHGAEHVLMRWPIPRFGDLAAHKASIGRLVGDLEPGGDGWVGDDGAPVPGTDVVAVNDAILPAMVERDPWWAGWCSVLVNVNDLSAMGASPVGLLDAIAVPTESLAARIVSGMSAASRAWGMDVLGGHTQIGVHAALSVTMLGRTDRPVPGGAARPGQRLSLVVDLGGGWRPGYTGRQWDSTSSRTPRELRTMHRLVADLRPAAAKDVSMAGLVGTTAMLAEASGVAVEVAVERIPRPDGARLADWLTCFPGFAMLIAHDDEIRADDARLDDQPAVVVEIGRIDEGHGVRLLWPDGIVEQVLDGSITGLGHSTPTSPSSRGASDDETHHG